ncbi:response regulator transcription factor [Paenibacillus thalictri]|uniref:Response regulator n=1 Tax=Paenibacillus thalictri TaxID=2527873 RepID=A0A4Q9DKL5_9BACL|nr:response regulator [Paenibacillus thalictri]TBL71381.1 response regulator [Paenibacillus thalictri]
MIKMMIVDDEYIIREGLKTMIPWERLGIDLQAVCSNAYEALDIINTIEPDIMLTDIRMPGMDGLELTEAGLAQYPQLKIILLTGFGEFQYAKQALTLGAFDILLKPTDEDELLRTLQKALEAIRKERSERESYFQLLCQQYMRQPSEASLDRLAGAPNAGEPHYAVASWQEPGAQTAAFYVLDSLASEGDIPAKLAEVISEHADEETAVPVGVSELLASLRDLPEGGYQATRALEHQMQHGGGIMLYSMMNHMAEILKVVDRVDRNFHEPLTVAKLAAELFVSEGYFSKMFKNATGKTFTDYITEKRIGKAKELLRDPRVKTYEVALTVGYTDQRYFSQVFKKAVGMTPREYRERENISTS